MAEKARRARVERLLEAARVLQDPAAAEGRALRSRLRETSGLSAPNIELCLMRCLETQPSDQQLADLLASTPEAPRAHVLLSANVFVAALRAIAIGLASSPSVGVRASRREPALAQALHALVPDLFQLLPELAPEPGDHFWSYGSDDTLARVEASLARGVWFHQHGAGFGTVVIDASTFCIADAQSIALDTALFDQRGCLSPRVVCVIGTSAQAEAVAKAIAAELAALERELPPGPQTPEQAAETRRNRDIAAYAHELFEAGSGWVSSGSELVVPPATRNLHVACTPEPAHTLAPFARHITCIGTNTDALRAELGAAFHGARLVKLGDMQRPPLDGPVDRRHGTHGELLA